MLHAIKFDTPEYIPMAFSISMSCWNHYEHNVLFDLIESHKMLFPDFVRPSESYSPCFPPNALANSPYTDPWQCVWETSEDGIVGAVHTHPLESWEAFDNYHTPDPSITDGIYPIDWEEITNRIIVDKKSGKFTHGGLPHGHTFLRLQDICGYENVLFDMYDEKPELMKLISMIEEFNCRYISRWIGLEPDMISYPEDLGMQIGPMISPEHFRKYIKPSYHRLMTPARDKNIIIHMHSDGDIRSLASDLIDCGIEVINIQDIVNGIDWIAENFAGKICVDLDIDRQKITYSGTAKQIDILIREEVEKIGSRRGGLMMIYGLYPGVPLENVVALMDAMERYSLYYS